MSLFKFKGSFVVTDKDGNTYRFTDKDVQSITFTKPKPEGHLEIKVTRY